MIDISNSKQSELKWKTKYLDSLDRLEILENTLKTKISTLTRSVLSVCRIGSDLNPKLEEQLTQLRAALRKDIMDTKIPNLIESLDKSIEKTANNEKGKQKEAIEALEKTVEQISEFKVPYSTKRNLSKLRRSISLQDQTTANITDHALQLIDYQHTILQNLIGAANETDIATLLAKNPSKSDTLEPQAGETKSDYSLDDFTPAQSHPAPPVSETIWSSDYSIKDIESQTAKILLQLLDKLEVSEPLTETAAQLRAAIGDKLSLDQLVNRLKSIVELTLKTTDNTQKEFNQFLKHLDEQLESIQSLLKTSQNQDQQRHDNQQKLQHAVSQIVSDINGSIAGADKLENLKSSVNKKLNNITSAIDDFHEEEGHREKKLMQQLGQLGQRLEKMEEHSKQVLGKLETQHEIAHTDNLTMLPNRRSYELFIEKEYASWRRYQTPLSLIIADIDHFKQINDEYGHLAGDKVLKLIGKVLSQETRVVDFVARYGGEEFVIVLPNTSDQDAYLAAEKLRKTIESCPFRHKKNDVSITMSFGISEFKEDDKIQMVFERADKLLYAAKHEGRNRCCLSAKQATS